MFRSLNIAATGMAAQETHLEAISNNIANSNTVGYKKQRVDFEDLLYQTVRAAGAPTGQTTMNPTGLQLGTGVRVVATFPADSYPPIVYPVALLATNYYVLLRSVYGYDQVDPYTVTFTANP